MFNKPIFNDPNYLQGYNDAHESDGNAGIDLVDDIRYKTDEWYKKGVDSKGGGFYRT